MPSESIWMRCHENPWRCRLHVWKHLAAIGSPDGLLSILETDSFLPQTLPSEQLARPLVWHLALNQQDGSQMAALTPCLPVGSQLLHTDTYWSTMPQLNEISLSKATLLLPSPVFCQGTWIHFERKTKLIESFKLRQRRQKIQRQMI